MADYRDNCWLVPNPDQANSSGSLWGDACATQRVLSMDTPADFNSSAQLSTVRIGSYVAVGVPAVGYVSLSSRPLRAADLRQQAVVSAFDATAAEIAIDIRPPSSVPNPYWLGSLQVSMSSLSAGVFNQTLGQVELSGVALQAITTLRLPIPASLVALLNGQASDIVISLALNTSPDAQQLWGLNHIRFYNKTATLPSKETIRLCPAVPGSIAGCDSALVLGFERAGDWTAAGGSVAATANRSQGEAALELRGTAYRTAVSTALDSADIARTVVAGAATPTVSFDVLVASNQPNPNWVGDLQVFVSSESQGIAETLIGQVALTNLTRGAWSTVTLPLTPALVSALTTPGATDVRFKLAVNTSGSAPLVIDNLTIRTP